MVSGGWGRWPYVWNVFIKTFFLHVLLIVKFSLSFKKGRRFSIRFLALLPPLSKVRPSATRNLILKDKEETRNFSESSCLPFISKVLQLPITCSAAAWSVDTRAFFKSCRSLSSSSWCDLRISSISSSAWQRSWADFFFLSERFLGTREPSSAPVVW